LLACTPVALDEAPAVDEELYTHLGLTEAEAESLLSLEQVDDYPLYTMYYYAPYENASLLPNEHAGSESSWACSLFAALGDDENMLFGRNFDWEYSPALLLYSDPPDGYASVSMVDIAYFGFERNRVTDLTNASLEDLVALLDTPYWPFDGFNEMGLAIGMAAVPAGDVQSDPEKETISSLGVIREVLDHAGDVDEAIAILQSFNINFEGGPPIHYLVADASGNAALFEHYQGEIHIIYNQAPWHLATNFLRASTGETDDGYCWRYDTLSEGLSNAGGRLEPSNAMTLLSDVSQAGTQWSIVYDISSGDIHVSMGRDYDNVHVMHLDLLGQ
jgi:hypothetical protein